ncbi:MAG: hypothetical protein DSY90_09435, partial [Deltaproteobacteria bacterium]
MPVCHRVFSSSAPLFFLCLFISSVPDDSHPIIHPVTENHRLYISQKVRDEDDELYIIGNFTLHFHLLMKILPESDFSDNEILKRCRRMYGDDYDIADERLPVIRKKLASLSELMRDIKVNFTRYYNRRHHRRGY